MLVARTGGAAGRLISLADARVLVACDSFDDDDAHAARIADDVELAEAEVVAGLLCSPTEPRHVDELVAAMARGPLSLEEEEHMIELAAMTNDA